MSRLAANWASQRGGYNDFAISKSGQHKITKKNNSRTKIEMQAFLSLIWAIAAQAVAGD
jgi:hypothetical protein